MPITTSIAWDERRAAELGSVPRRAVNYAPYPYGPPRPKPFVPDHSHEPRLNPASLSARITTPHHAQWDLSDAVCESTRRSGSCRTLTILLSYFILKVPRSIRECYDGAEAAAPILAACHCGGSEDSTLCRGFLTLAENHPSDEDFPHLHPPTREHLNLNPAYTWLKVHGHDHQFPPHRGGECHGINSVCTTSNLSPA